MQNEEKNSAKANFYHSDPHLLSKRWLKSIQNKELVHVIIAQPDINSMTQHRLTFWQLSMCIYVPNPYWHSAVTDVQWTKSWSMLTAWRWHASSEGYQGGPNERRKRRKDCSAFVSSFLLHEYAHMSYTNCSLGSCPLGVQCSW